METSRDDVGIAIRSAFLSKGTKQRFSVFVLIIVSILLIFLETFDTKPLNSFRSLTKDVIYRGSIIVSYPGRLFKGFNAFVDSHFNLYDNYGKLKKENYELKNNISNTDFLELENAQLRKLINEQVTSKENLASARVIIDKQSPYVNSFIVNIGSNKGVKNGLAVLSGTNFIGRTVDVNYFSSRVLLVSDLNSKIPVVVEPSGTHAILAGHGLNKPALEYLPKDHSVKEGDKIFTSGKGGVFSPGIPIGTATIEKNSVKVFLFSSLDQLTFVNINLNEKASIK